MNRLTTNIYEINSRVWINKLGSQSGEISISKIPDEYWLKLKKLGIDYIWLMGAWETVPSSVEKYCFTDGLKEEYSKALPDWKKDDVIGSPYAINDYKLNPLLGTHEEISKLKEQLNSIGLKLILDFIPNHFHADTELLKTNPELFLQCSESLATSDNVTYYKPDGPDNYFAHGKDPNFAAWQDTVQVNYYSAEARKLMTDKLKELATICDGVRCDMAMLPLNDIFYKTWKDVIDSESLVKPDSEFWVEAISEVKKHNKDFLFVAEVYWNMEWTLQQQGFDFTYDKSLYDRIVNHNARSINEHLLADIAYQSRSVRFIENHDEQRAKKALGKSKLTAAVTLISTLPGMHLYHDGQFEGKQIRLPAQLGRLPDEYPDEELEKFYTGLLTELSSIDFNEYSWQLLHCNKAGESDNTNNNFITYAWICSKYCYTIIINYSEQTSYCRLNIPLNSNQSEIQFTDILTGDSYKRFVTEITNEGIFISLPPFGSHIFSFKI